jgi:hypothetical protein
MTVYSVEMRVPLKVRKNRKGGILMKKRIISVVISAIAFISLMNSAKPMNIYADDVLAEETTIETISEDILMGDVNGDGKVNSIDASLVLRTYANYSTGGEDILTAQ